MQHITLQNQAILAQLPGSFIWKDLTLKCLACTPDVVKLTGFKSLDQVIGTTDYDLQCNAVESAEVFRAQDKQVIDTQKELALLDIHPYADGKLHMFLTRKRPFYDQNKAIAGTAIAMMEINDSFISNLSLELLQLDKHYRSKTDQSSLSAQIKTSFDFKNLTRKESSVLFYLLRGKSANEIGQILHRSPRTIEIHIDNIKQKMGVTKKSDVIMYCVEQGFLNIVPQDILPKLTNISINLQD